MKAIEPRTELVNVRFTKPEKQVFLRALADSGCKTVAEFVRLAALGLVKPAYEQPSVRLEEQVAQLTEQVRQLSLAVEMLKHPTTGQHTTQAQAVSAN